MKIRTLAGRIFELDVSRLGEVSGDQSVAEMTVREVLLATLLGLLNQPATSLVRILNEPASALVRVLKAKADASGRLG